MNKLAPVLDPTKSADSATLPKGWRYQLIGDVCKIFGRIGFRGYTVNDIVAEGQGAISLSPSNIQAGRITLARNTFISWEKWEESPEIKIENGDIILVKTGSTVGKAAIVRGLSVPATLNPQMVTFKRRRINETFLGYVVTSEDFQSQLAATAVGGAIPTLSQKEIAGYRFACPEDPREQEAIAEALSDADALIEGLDRLIAKKRLIKQGAMQDLLTAKGHLQGFSGEWVPRPLSSISSFITKGATPTTYGFGWEAHGILFLRSECVSPRGLDLSQSMFISEAAHRAIKRSEVSGGDILITITGNVGRVVRLPNDFVQANINQHIARIRITSDEVNADFVFHQLSRPDYLKHFNSIVTGQAYPQISLQQVREAEIHFPEAAEQMAIAEILNDMDAEIQALETRLDKARQVKEGMMQNLLTGRIRLV
ncbi:MAG: restriction endonuclease subunit S [Alphaproteobacteria bacterium]|nr:restriction endonuclease subunit S [Alphaproteobacteria bacterium]MBU1280736.1 restriction endonuclease subunit S [Alphaproteobacteria bacterium]MBU1573345.1 restriction endonuclease subunit S [Alphaproteobacteria bacterium]MBU1827502.1 restriction endonuclease subunit S [Alphaproteobacteria bacterium]MBU2077309.1 restriction endonuclease subunit S [Alphaproteobacteria bacterium]